MLVDVLVLLFSVGCLLFSCCFYVCFVSLVFVCCFKVFLAVLLRVSLEVSLVWVSSRGFSLDGVFHVFLCV